MDLMFKVLVVGDMYTGKTSIIKRYVHGTISKNYKATVHAYLYIYILFFYCLIDNPFPFSFFFLFIFFFFFLFFGRSDWTLR